MPAKRSATTVQSSATIGFDAKPWPTDGRFRNNMDAAELDNLPGSAEAQNNTSID